MKRGEWKRVEAWQWQRYAITQHAQTIPTVGASLLGYLYVATYELARWDAGRPQMQLVQLGVYKTLDKARAACEKHAAAVRRGDGAANDNGQLETRQAK